MLHLLSRVLAWIWAVTPCLFQYLAGFFQHHVFFLFALIPGVIGIFAHGLQVPKKKMALESEHQRYRELRNRISKEWGDAAEQAADSKKLLDDFAPRWLSILVGALIVTITFSIAAVLSDPTTGIGVAPSTSTAASTPMPTSTGTSTRTASPTQTPTPPGANASGRTADASGGAAAAPGQDAASPKASVAATPTSTPSATPQGQAATARGDGKRGLVLAAYGSYVATVYILISRLDSSGLTGLFLINSGLHAAIAMVLGFVAGDFKIFGSLTNNPDLLYFVLGMFPFWAIDYLKKKAVVVFQTAQEPACENVALCLVDGLDDPIIDRLTESGIWNVQHLAAADPLEISARTLYPLDRVLDWIDQAILIAVVKSNIVAYRDRGIRGASELASIYGEYAGQVFTLRNIITQRDNANSLFDKLATATKVERPAIEITGERLLHDRQVNLIIRWRRAGRGPINAAVLVEAVLGAVREAAHEATVKFDPAPALGQPVSPLLGGLSALEHPLPVSMDKALSTLGYRWAGVFADVANLKSWNEVVNEILNRTISEPSGAQVGSSP